jgi:hypothetical protein
MMRLRLYPVIVAFGALALSANAPAWKVLSDSQMRQLAIAGVRAKAPGALRHHIGFERSNRADYAWFEGWINIGEGHVGLFVIDPRTGDMWDGVSECGEITSPEIRRLQRNYRKQLNLSAARYSKIKRRGPMCDQIAR